jgi:integrase
MGQWRSTEKTRYPGIYRVTRGSTVRYVVSFRVRGSGQRTKSFQRLEDAKRFQGEIRDPKEAARQQRKREDRTTLADYFPVWLEARQKLTASTRRRYADVGRIYIADSSLGRMRLSDITRSDVKGWVESLAQRGAHPPTIDKAARTLRACLNEAVKDGRIEVNPATRIETPDMDDREAFFLTAGQVDAIAQEVPDRDRALVYALAYTGMRIGEATALRVGDVDFLRKRIKIERNAPEVAGRKLEPGKTKNKGKRAVPLFEGLSKELAAHLDRFGIRDAAGELVEGSLVFTSAQGGVVRQNNFRGRIFQPAAVRVGVVRPSRDGEPEAPRVHDLRHTFASLAAASGYSLHELKTMLGHSTITITSNLYAHMYDDHMAEKAEQLDKVMQKARAGGEVVPLREVRA